MEQNIDPVIDIIPSNATPEASVTPPSPTARATSYRFPIFYVILVTLGGPLAFLYWSLDSWYIVKSFPNKHSGFGLFFLLSLIYIALTFVCGIINIIQSFQLYKKNDPAYCLNAMLIMKYGMIPFFILHFVISSIFCFAVGFGVRSWSMYIAVIIIALVDAWLLMLPGSFYGIQVIRSNLREKKTSLFAAIIHGIAQFLLVADVIDATYLAATRWRRFIKILLVVFSCALLALFLYYFSSIFLYR